MKVLLNFAVVVLFLLVVMVNSEIEERRTGKYKGNDFIQPPPPPAAGVPLPQPQMASRIEVPVAKPPPPPPLRPTRLFDMMKSLEKTT